MKRVQIVVMLSVLVGACSSSPPRSPAPVFEGGSSAPESGGAGGTTAPPLASQPKPNPNAEQQSYEQQQPVAPAPSGGAVVALLDRADYFKESGDIDAEAATVERALRINPADAGLWSRLAAVRLEQGQPQQAEQLALKSNSLAAGNTDLQARNWLMVARARWAQDDSDGARAAEQRAVELRTH